MASIVWHHVKTICGKAIYYLSIKQNRDTRILVVLHLYYMDSWPFIKRYLENLSSYNYDLVVTYVYEHYDPLVLENVRDFKNDVFIKEYKNKGFDIGGFIDILSRYNLRDYDIVFKLHSKGIGRSSIFIYDQVFKKADWFLNLFDGILGEFSVHKAIKLLMKNSNIGLVASANLIVKDPLHKRSFTCAMATQLGVPIDEHYHFVAGSCFAIKAPLLSLIQGLHLTIDCFETTRRGVFSLAHALERIVCASVETQGYSLRGIHVQHPRYSLERRYRQSVSPLRLLDDDRFTIDYDYFYRALEMFPVFSYSIKTMRLGDIRRYWEGRYYSLRECPPYAYISGDIDSYEQYTKANVKNTAFEMSRERFDELIKSLEENGFDEKRLPIVCSLDNSIWDGQHRCCWLLSRFGEDYQIPIIYIEANPWYLNNAEPYNTRLTKLEMNVWKKIWRALSYKKTNSALQRNTHTIVNGGMAS